MLKREIEQGNVNGEILLDHFKETDSGAPTDIFEAVTMYRRALNSDKTGAINLLNKSIRKMAVSFKDELQFISMIQNEIEQGNFEAASIAAERFKKGDNIQQIIFKAIEIYRLAINHGDVESFPKLNNVISTRKITSKNGSQFIKMLKNEIQYDYYVAMNVLANCYYSGKGVSINKFKAIDLYRRSANLGFKTAKNNLKFFDFNFEVNPENESK
jgi:TPR repeat protein